ncbi:TetR/AcrR family transcriptional regulator C-terminal domain-containing protein [Spiractinospora alimapuensis]|uniref:TetR/AcrR family transcriptional regulator n=1 Tax=Spiractinospora alimapuensis TaxID=2820884 RepID=UPI001F308CFC|nr:TetR/AcrR family transcriptional regulator C-terminal domain-containing protein [Spiractinospora alimapuensis]QVQ51194.1 TetR/AcrR family transcriptional regulator C-terminal domain-containing protein [Spiractinospora alimapuensis]
MPRPKSLTHCQIAAAALNVVEREGVDALSMRAVAQELGMGTMSLYRYVSDRAQVEELVVDQVLRAVELRVPTGTPGERLYVLAERVRSAVLDHAPVVPLLLLHRHRAPSSVRWGEAVLTVLTEAGIHGQDRVIAFRAVLGYLCGALQVEYFGSLSGAGTAALAAVPTDEFPLLAETAAEAKDIPPDEEFRRGFAIVLRGLGW